MRSRFVIYLLCLIAFIAHAGFAFSARHTQASWANVPPVPTKQGATMLALGDPQFAYRAIGITIQNLGDVGGRTTALKDYNYERLGQWFYLQDSLDPRSNFIPLLAAYYFGATQNPDDLDPVIDYLATIGQRDYGEKWRWLAQAAYLARFDQNDLDKAMELAHILAGLNYEGMPIWASQMPAFIAAAKGDKETALGLMLSLLRDKSGALHPNEVNFIVDFICNRLLDKDESATYPLCQNG